MFDSAKVGDTFTNINTKLISNVIERTETSICIFNKRATKKGINSTNWYTKDTFERKFKI